MKLANSKVTATRLVQDALKKAEHFSDHNIFTFLASEFALMKAKDIDRRIAAGQPVGPLAGAVYALKDNFLSTVGPTTAASQMLEHFNSPLDATMVKRLDQADAIMLGRVNLDAFAHGASTENSYFGPTKNAIDPTRVAGGSSGGSAVAVALNIVDFATGTDTGGSIRQPAVFNGVYGFKPTYGAISRFGVVAMASSTDSMGFFTKSTEDLDLLMQITASQDRLDPTSLPDFYQTTPTLDRQPVIGLIKDLDTTKLDPAIQDSLNQTIEHLKKQGIKTVELSMPHLQYALAVYYIVVPAEVSSNLSRYDGIRYGLRSPEAQTLDQIYTNSRSQGFMPENKRRIMIGNFVLSSGFYDAYYLKAQKVRTLIIEDYKKAFTQCDFLLTPVSPHPAFKLGEKVNDPVSMYLEDVLSVPANLAGLPSLAFPAGTTPAGLPLGLQLTGPRRSDRQLIKFVANLEAI